MSRPRSVPRPGVGLAVFLAISFGLSWGLWEYMAATGWRPGAQRVSWAVLAGAFAPALGAVAARLADGSGFGDAGLALRLGRGWRWYLLGLLLPLPGAAVVLALTQALGLASVHWDLNSGLAGLGLDARTGPDFPAAWLWLTAPLNALMAAPILFGEEFGWRGYLQQRLWPSRPLLAAVVTGVVWAGWHIPLNLRGYNFPNHPMLGQAVFTVSCVLLSITLGWLTRVSGSIWCASLAHSAVNTVGASLVILAIGGRQDLYAVYLGVLGWVPLGLFAGWLVLSGRLRPDAKIGDA